jgi:hypothetical protein
MTDAPNPAQDDLFPLQTPTKIGPPTGTVEGPPGWHEGFGAGLRVWCGPQAGWRSLGDVLGGARPVGCKRICLPRVCATSRMNLRR